MRYVQAYAEAARQADPSCRILGGFNYEGKPGALDVPLEFIKLGGTKWLDVLTLHSYPMRNKPEFIEPVLQQVGEAMDQQGGRKPIWFTEFAYYADDDPWGTPMVGRTSQPNERIQAENEVRFCVICLANGVEKVFYHAGTGSAINHSNLWTQFLRYGSEPFKNYPSQAVMAQLFTPTCKFVKRLMPDQPVRAYLFRDTDRTVGVIWAPSDVEPKAIKVGNPKLQLWDIMGRPLDGRAFTPGAAPVYVVGEGVSPEEIEKAIVQSNLTKDEVIHIAEDTAKAKGYKLSDYDMTGCHYEFIGKDHTWWVFFELKPPGFPGGHFLVWIDDETKKAELRGGQ